MLRRYIPCVGQFQLSVSSNSALELKRSSKVGWGMVFVQRLRSNEGCR